MMLPSAADDDHSSFPCVTWQPCLIPPVKHWEIQKTFGVITTVGAHHSSLDRLTLHSSKMLSSFRCLPSWTRCRIGFVNRHGSRGNVGASDPNRELREATKAKCSHRNPVSLSRTLLLLLLWSVVRGGSLVSAILWRRCSAVFVQSLRCLPIRGLDLSEEAGVLHGTPDLHRTW